MSQTNETKQKILLLLSGKQQTMSELSRELQLAPSTVSEHLKALKEEGVIEQVDNPFIKKWKYYYVVEPIRA
jgi:predicted transcriptional regulator